VEKQGEGEPGRDGLLQQIRPWQEEFRGAIRETAPCFVPQFRKRPAREGEVLEERESTASVKSRPDPLFLEGEERATAMLDWMTVRKTSSTTSWKPQDGAFPRPSQIQF
jgi:hypothetical protein